MKIKVTNHLEGVAVVNEEVDDVEPNKWSKQSCGHKDKFVEIKKTLKGYLRFGYPVKMVAIN
ncbi:hypothetical protein KY285_023848 [Solanum tuberosum]|nr:hypothetical protein KY289_024176 [Solanum tuberosum]KAH0676047.1 hypothetical protein KY285_023848 [Solanum tuberosum]